MTEETIRTIVTSVVTATSTLGAAGIVAYFGYRTTKLKDDRDTLKNETNKLAKDLRQSYQEIAAYYELEGEYSEELAKNSSSAQKTIKSKYRKIIGNKNGFIKPERTSTEMTRLIKQLDSEYPK